MSVYKLAGVITAHSWNADRTQVAVCENEPDIFIYENANATNVAKWQKAHILRQHTMVVTGLDWEPKSDKIVSCSHDVNAFVWSYDQRKKVWEPKLSILRINRAALKCRWSPDGTKFAVASGAKVVPVCYYERNQDWWVSKMIKKHRSTVLDVAWHPSSQLVATASCDFKCRVFNAFVPSNDKAGKNTVFGNMEGFEFGQLVTELESGIGGQNQSNGGWIEAVAWNNSGTGLCFAGHDSTISFVQFQQNQAPICITVRSQTLPFTSLLFLKDNILVAAGYDFQPFIFTGSSSAWTNMGSCDPMETGGATGQPEKKKGGFVGKMKMWEKKVRQGNEAGNGTDALKSCHHNAITDICLYDKTSFSTSGIDGRIVIWDKDTLNKNVEGLTL